MNATFGGGFPEFTGQGTITDIDGPPPLPTLSFTTTDFNVAEEVTGGNFIINLGFTGRVWQQVTYDIAVSTETSTADDATKVDDYDNPSATSESIASEVHPPLYQFR